MFKQVSNLIKQSYFFLVCSFSCFLASNIHQITYQVCSSNKRHGVFLWYNSIGCIHVIQKQHSEKDIEMELKLNSFMKIIERNTNWWKAHCLPWQYM